MEKITNIYSNDLSNLKKKKSFQKKYLSQKGIRPKKNKLVKKNIFVKKMVFFIKKHVKMTLYETKRNIYKKKDPKK